MRLGGRKPLVIAITFITMVVPLVGGLPVTPETGTPACPGVAEVEGVGLACEGDDGLLHVFGPDGTDLGTVAPPHPHSAHDVEVRHPWSRSLKCVDPAEDPYHVKLIYAVSHDDEDRGAEGDADVVSYAERANRILFDAGRHHGLNMDLETECDADGNPIVAHEVLSISKSDAGFGWITWDLRQKGYTDTRVKHWVYYDNECCGSVGGVGHIYGDDRLILENRNNGAAWYPMFAVTFGLTGNSAVKVMLHELGHNLGAVQNSAPHSTGGWHCTDGFDIMCYNDNGHSGNAYKPIPCSAPLYVHSHAFDCLYDDYFHPDPLPGTYLASHWNVGSPLNRYIDRSVAGDGLTECPGREVPNAGSGCALP